MAEREPVTLADAALCSYLQSVELAAAATYTAAITMLSDTSQPVATTFRSHHSTYADSLANLAATAAAKGPNQPLSTLLSARLQAATDEIAALTFLFGVENQLAATHAFAANTATSPDVIRLLSTTLPMTAARCAALGGLAKLSTPLLFPNGPVESALVGDGSDVRLGFDPASFPVS